MKTIFSFYGSDEPVQTAVEFIKPAKVISLNAPVLDYLPEIFRVSPESFKHNEPFREPILVQQHHINHFFTKVNGGAVAVQNYVGKELKDPQQAIAYYRDTVIKKALGATWLFQYFKKELDYEPNGIYVVTDYQPFFKELKTEYKHNFQSVLIDDESFIDLPSLQFDHILKFKSKTALKKDLGLIVSKLRGKYDRTRSIV